MAWPLEAERLFWADACRDNLALFVRKVYGVDRNPKGRWWSDDIHLPLCDWLQGELLAWLERRRHGIRERTYLAALLPRAAAKTQCITKAAMMWLHLHDPDLSTYIGNEKLENAEDFLLGIKGHLSGQDDYSWWPWLYGNWRTDERRWRSDSIVHAGRKLVRSEASFGLVSTKTGLTGKHPDVLCLDDLVSYEGMAGDSRMLDNVYAFITNLIPVVEADGLIILVGTRYADGDPCGRSFDNDGILSVAGMPDPDYQPREGGIWRVYFMAGRHPDGRPAMPGIWSDAAMKQYANREPLKYAFQVLNRPKENPYRPLTEAQFDACLAPETPPKLRITLHLDTAFKQPDRIGGNSESAIVAMGHDQTTIGRVWFLGAWHSREWLDQTFTTQLIDIFKSFKARGYVVSYLTDELETSKAGVWPNALNTSFALQGLQRPPMLTFDRKKGASKDVRIFDAINMVTKGMVKFWDKAPGLSTIRYQLCNHPASARKDVADAFADVFHKDIYRAMTLVTPQKDTPWEPGGWEEATKSIEFWKRATMSDDTPDREPIGAIPGLVGWPSARGERE